MRQKDLEERLGIFAEYKKLINEILAKTIMRRQGRKVSKEELFSTLAEFVMEENQDKLTSEHVFDNLKYVMAVEDFRVF